MNHRLWTLACVALPALACNLSSLPLIPTSQPQQPESLIAPALTETSVTTPDIAPSVTPPEIPVDPICVQPASPDPIPMAPFEEFPSLLLEYLNAGGSAPSLLENLENLGIANERPSVSAGDLTGDRKIDVVVSILEPDPQTFPPPGALLIFTCLGDHYILTHIELSEVFLAAPRILHLQDMNADGTAELIFSSSICGAHTCFESTQILSWNGEIFVQSLVGVTDDLPFPDLQVTDYDLDGIYDLEMTSSGYGSVGAGPQRPLTRIWEYNPANGTWDESQEILGVSNYRIHMLHDADSAARKAEYDVAFVLYNQVINNTDLLDWTDRDTERLDLGAYARYKLVVIYTLRGDVERAQIFYDEMNNIFPVSSPQRAFVDMASDFLDGFSQGGQAGGCSAAHQYAALHAGAILVPLGSQTYGYANPDYSPLDVCP